MISGKFSTFSTKNRPNRALDQPLAASKSSSSVLAKGKAPIKDLRNLPFWNQPSGDTSSVQCVDGGEHACCVIDAIAGVTGGDYRRAHEAAIEGGWDPSANKGWFFGPARDVLSNLGVNAVYHKSQPNNWNKFPHKAIVSVKRGGENHAVILRGDYIYDGDKSRAIHRNMYTISDTSSYIEIKPK
jgi:hypothetical protein